MSAELVVTNLVKTFTAGAKPAVDDVSFTVATGEIVVLLGPSGCGKTTTLRMVAGLERPTAGEISIGGRVVVRPATGEFVPAQNREIGMVFQSYAVWPHMTVYDNVAYPLRRRRFSRADIDKKVGDVLDVVGLQEYAKRSVVALSGGQMQRVALARALVYQPQILLLDEPLSNLDAKLRLRLRDDLRRIIKETGVTALYVTHDQAEAVVLGDRIGVMQDGFLLQMTDPVQLYNRPANLFVANFTGASNAINGQVASVDGGLGHVKVPTGEIVHATVPATIRAGDAATIAVRPENLVLSNAPTNGSSSDNHFPARVVHEQFQGTFSVYTVEALGTKLEVTELGTVPRFPLGSTVTLEMRAEHCWVFPNAG